MFPLAIMLPLIMGGVSAGASIIGGKLASNGVKRAADTQAKAGEKAIVRYDQIYNEQKQRQQPYMDFGRQALGNLGQMSGQQAPTFNPQQPMNGWQPQQAPQKPMGMGQPDPQSRVASQGGGVPMGPQAGMESGGMVQMRGPDGRVRPVPHHLVPQAKAAGGIVVG
jgi:hypothetical protein